MSTVERLAAITGPWFDEGYEAGRLDPAELARRIAADPSLVCDHPDAAAALEATEPLPEDAPGPWPSNPRRLYAEGWTERGDAIRAALAAPARREATDGR